MKVIASTEPDVSGASTASGGFAITGAFTACAARSSTRATLFVRCADAAGAAVTACVRAAVKAASSRAAS